MSTRGYSLVSRWNPSILTISRPLEAGDLPAGRPVYQFLSIKFVLFVPYIQNLVLQLLIALEYIKDGDTMSILDVVTAINSLLICFEMAVASVLHIMAFPASEFETYDESAVRIPISEAIMDALRPDDLWNDALWVYNQAVLWLSGEEFRTRAREENAESSDIIDTSSLSFSEYDHLLRERDDT
ncbi:hypothetical protein HDU67_001119 [Dinochytrium kinnereticum]|nr:hypothetical protein HDU67_001119 [Dinochytrium kinnereticum]